MNKKNNPFEIRKSPVEIIAAQAVALDDCVMRVRVEDGTKSCATLF